MLDCVEVQGKITGGLNLDWEIKKKAEEIMFKLRLK